MIKYSEKFNTSDFILLKILLADFYLKLEDFNFDSLQKFENVCFKNKVNLKIANLRFCVFR